MVFNALFFYSGLAVIIAFALVMLFGAINYRVFHESKYSILKNFPFEMNDKYDMPMNTLVVLFYTLTTGLICVTYYFVFSSLPNVFFKVEIGVGILCAILMLSMFMIRLFSDKIHIILSTAFMVLSSMNSIYLGYLTIRFKYCYIYGALPYLFFALGLFQLLIIFNPYLKKWMKLDKNEEGQLERPKVFILAFSEWLFIITNMIQLILIVTGID